MRETQEVQEVQEVKKVSLNKRQEEIKNYFSSLIAFIWAIISGTTLW